MIWGLIFCFGESLVYDYIITTTFNELPFVLGFVMDGRYCKKYRKSYWIITYIIQRKILKRFESKIKEEHAEFRPGRSWTDRINTPGIIIDHSGKFQLQLNMLFMGFQRAFDTINHDCMWITLESQGIHTKIINLIQGL